MGEPREETLPPESLTEPSVGLQIVLTQQDGPNPPGLIAQLVAAVRFHFEPLPEIAEPAELESLSKLNPQVTDSKVRVVGRIDQIAAGNPERVAERQKNPPTAEQESAEKAETQRRLDEVFARLREKGFRITGQPAGVEKPA